MPNRQVTRQTAAPPWRPLVAVPRQISTNSDSGFTGSAVRTCDEGLTIMGFGEQKTPEVFRSACYKFILTAVLRCFVSAVAILLPSTRGHGGATLHSFKAIWWPVKFCKFLSNCAARKSVKGGKGLGSHRQQMKHARAAAQFFKRNGLNKYGKKANKALYACLKHEAKGMYDQCFQLAFDQFAR